MPLIQPNRQPGIAGDLLQIDKVVKRFGRGRNAVDHISFSAGLGVVGLLGPNGAGKSSLMRMLVGLMAPDSGGIGFDGMDPSAEEACFKACIGYLPQDFGLYPDVSALALLNHLAALKGIAGRRERTDQVEQLLRAVNLWEVRHQTLGGYSGGMRQRFGIAQALLGRPRLIVVDEPTAGLDPEERYRLLGLLASRRHEAVIVLSTHLVQDVAELCSRALILNDGRLLADAHPTQAPMALSGRVWRVEVEPEAVVQLAGLRVLHSRLAGGHVVAHCLAEVAPTTDASLVTPSLEDFYFATLLGADHVA
ncbi:MAG: ATP-binding cassette domain-containing protein [Xanthomonadaceae bacterium]|nr:ATP-binding cassette domain-containing protein [Xanthomonadaceae bacterium]MDP2183890.1 ATP-binding cassette domain-containing protein [Xanthomonadales bacterium]MDZ4117588.1 ATP-binding cassette domain-containing protein [Xanthomonadaceae bacterium]MDZ4379570.1 ATP-binding cassette domain-containing protein [Xanthomonadaceae bacterium]